MLRIFLTRQALRQHLLLRAGRSEAERRERPKELLALLHRCYHQGHGKRQPLQWGGKKEQGWQDGC